MAKKEDSGLNKKQLGLRIKSAREQAGMTQEEFVKALGRSRNAISLLENGKVTPSLEFFMDAISIFRKRKVDLSLDYLCGLTEKSSISSSYHDLKEKYEALLREFNNLQEVAQLQRELLKTKKGRD